MTPGDVQVPGRFARLTDNMWFQRLIVWGALVGLYAVIAAAAGPYYVPSLSSLTSAMYHILTSHTGVIFLTSFKQLAIGFGIAIGVGVPLGLVIGTSRVADVVVGMYARSLFVTSLIALLPLLIVIFGTGLLFRVIVVFLLSVFFIILQTASGVHQVPRALVWTARSFNAPSYRVFWHVLLPGSLSFIVAGIRLGLANAFSGMIVAELWVLTGTGELLTGWGLNRDLPPYFGAVFLITLAAGLAASALKSFEKRVLRRWDSA